VTTEIEFFLAPHSPWVHIGYGRLKKILKKYNTKIIFKPIDFLKVLKFSGGVPVKDRPKQKQIYRLNEINMWSSYLKIPIKLNPKFFPVNYEKSSKLLIAAQFRYESEITLNLLGLISKAMWEEEENIDDLKTLQKLINLLNLVDEKLLTEMNSQTVNDAYIKNTEEAIRTNIFGVPWYRINEKNFWGQDRLDFLERELLND
tara:strand:+ start:1330 stop:1935 length:606 start_codon:yes stop_codon:yes gene_type:complete